MRRCPTCQRTYEGSLKFCQADGTPLIDESTHAPSGGFGSSANSADDQNDFADSDLDPMKTMIGVPPAGLPPPSPFSDPPNSAGLSSPSFGDLSSTQTQSASNDFTPGGSQPANNFGGAADNSGSAPSFKEPEPQFGNQAGYNQSPFNNQPSEWSPPPAPQDWQNQGLNQNTAFSAPPLAQNATNPLAIVSLVSGILSVTVGFCCYLGLLLGPVALVTGFLARRNIAQSPTQLGGKGFAIAGIVMGAISTVFSLGAILYLIIVIVTAPR